jgi:inner membrane protein
MMRRTHAAAGLASGFALAYLQHDTFVPGMVIALSTELAALLPDLDLKLGLKHRGVTHSLPALAFITVLALWVERRLALPVAIGYSSHLFLDMLTVYGIPLLWPVHNRFRLAKLRTGGRIDHLLSMMAVCAGAGAFFLMLKIFL